MDKYKTINGWTKEKMKAQIKKMNTGYASMVEGSGVCAYRGVDPSGQRNACAVGCFIPDEKYSALMDRGIGIVVTELFNQFPNIMSDMPLPEEALVSMQRVHDRIHPSSQTTHDKLFSWIEDNVVDSEA